MDLKEFLADTRNKLQASKTALTHIEPSDVKYKKLMKIALDNIEHIEKSLEQFEKHANLP